MPGPIPKRSTERRRRNADSKVETAPPLVDDVLVPEPDATWHPIATQWYAALADSGQSRFFEPSDWAAAYFVADTITRLCSSTKFSSVLFAAVWSAMGDLLTTEADRRRVRLEIERPDGEAKTSAGVTALAEYRRRVG